MPQHEMIGRTLYFADIVGGKVEIQEVYVRNANETGDVLMLSEGVKALGSVNAVFVDSPDIAFTKLVAAGRLFNRIKDKHYDLLEQIRIMVTDCDAVLKYIAEGNLNEPEIPGGKVKDSNG